jgi:hypothetical protein
MRAIRLALLAGAFALVAMATAVAPALAQVVTTPPPATRPPDTQPPATEPPVTSPPRTEPPATTSPATTAPSTATTRPRTTATRTRGTTTSSTSTTKPGPTTTIFVIPGDVGPTTTLGSTTIATIPQNDDVPTWSTNLFWIGVGGALAIVVTTFVMTGRSR